MDLYSPAIGNRAAVATPTGLADLVRAMMDTERLDRVDLIGNSVGGIVAQILASSVPQRVRRLVLVGTGANTAGARPAFAAAVDRWITSASDGGQPSRGMVEDIVGTLFANRPADASWQTYVEAVQRTNPAYLAAVLHAARRIDLTPRLADITAPTLVIRGDQDRARSAAHSAQLTVGIPMARSVEMPGAGHSPMVDHPAEFAHLVLAHIAAVGT